jgi:suppressor of ftsI/bilirubin oxidase
VQNRAATYWYHPHPHGLTGGQANRGLAGLFVVVLDDEARLRQALDLEFGTTDIPLVIQDKRFDGRGQLVYLSGGEMEQFSGFFGDTVAVNLTINPSLDVASRLYRFRILNGSNARTYRLAFTRGSANMPFFLIGTDGGLLAMPGSVDEVFLSPAERADVLLDLRDLNEGEVVFLDSLPFDPMHNEMGGMGSMEGHGGMGGMHGGSGGASEPRLPEGERFHVLRLGVRRRIAYDKAIPNALSQVATTLDPSGAARGFELSQGMMMQWLINGRAFEMDSTLFTTQRSAKETWEVTNVDASMPHPMHLHGFQFRVQERRNSPEQMRRLTTDGRGRLATDVGWKDTVLVWPGETVMIAVDLSHNFEGEQTFLWHCHNLEHEDQGMMANFRVT